MLHVPFRPIANRSALTISLFVTTAIASQAQRVELVPVPVPTFEGVESALQEELVSARANLDRAVADETTETVALANAFGLMGTLYLAVSQNPAALACLSNATRMAPEDARWHMALGASLLVDNERAQAVGAFQSALRLTPDDPVVHLRLGQLLAGEPETVGQSIVHLRAARAGLVDNLPILTSLGKALAQTGQHQAALEPFDKALELDPDDREALNYRARARSQTGNDAGAVEDLRHLVSTNPENRQARLDLAAILTRQGNFPEAEIQLEAALELELRPRARVLALFNLAGLRQHVGDNDGAITRYQEVLALAPDFPDAHFNLGVGLARAGRLEAAADHFERVTLATPGNASGWMALAKALISADRTDDAIAAVERGLEEGPAGGMRDNDAEQLRQLLGTLRVP